MAFVYEHKKIPRRKIIEQREGRFTRLAAVEITAVIFHAVAIADLAHHFQVVFGALFQPLGFQQFARLLERAHFAL